jgi:CspA family cold shock protein
MDTASTRGALAVGPARTGLDSARQYVRERRSTPMSGTIKKLVAERGFGFITADDGNDYFFHRSGSVDFDRLDTGVKVSFVTEPSPKGPRATNVRAEV